MNQRVREVLFVGVGKMGLPMATHLHAAGHRVIAFDPSPERRALAAQRGLAVVERLEPALARAPVVVSSLPDDAALRAVAAQVGAHAAAGAVWIDTSTVSPEASRDAAAQAAARGVACLRAPVSGNNVMAERAALTVFVSGDRAAYDACEPLFACWGPQRFWLGEAEQARVAKLAVNLMIVGTSTMLAEALALGERGGLEWQRLWDVVEASAVASPIVKAKAPALRAHDYTPTFTVEQMRKDVSLIRAAAAALGVATPVTDVAAAALDRAAAAGEGGDDYAVVIRDARRPH
ncbi:NAD(P)-dependent oxidoreductase [Azohydromonas sediminis]|uniref:NAD(P)-dependent oxidoreductase n=1 Tax=Azohydromonas sediminis TaxID=2259674 RepID=UPI000E659C09|nr:NAD(P)-dependent oxidoreductase [Azohydromonas sediminis]